MKITILTSGTRGDVQPFIALGVALRELGAEVTIVASVNFESLVTSYGLGFSPTRVDISKVMQSGELEASGKKAKTLKVFSVQKDNNFLSRLIDVQEDYYTACEDTDVIIYHVGAAIGHMIAKEKGIISILGCPFPIMETDEYPAILFYQKKLPKAFNRLTHKIFKKGFWMATKKPLEVFYRERLHKRVPIENPIDSSDLKLVSCSQSIFKTPNTAFAGGYWFLDEPGGYIPPDSLTEFLTKGSKPIYIGFGSIGNQKEAVEKTKMIVSAIEQSNCRAIIATGFGGLKEIPNLPESIYLLKEAPHSWLFPRCSIAIHHGGAGTTAEGFRSGIPMIIVPHGNDQYAWGKRVFELGVGSAPIGNEELTTENLVNAIEFAGSKSVIENAKKLSRVIRQENGAMKAAQYVMAYLQKKQISRDLV